MADPAVYARDKAGNEYKGDEITVWVSDKGIMPQRKRCLQQRKTGDGTKEDNTERFTERSEAEPERRAHGQEAGGTHETTREAALDLAVHGAFLWGW